MINTFKSAISTSVLMLCLFILVTGLSAGIFFGGIMPAPEKAQMAAILQDIDAKLLPSLIINALSLLMIGLAGFTVYGFPLALILLLYRSFSVGFCDCLLLYSAGSDNPAGFVFTFLLPQLLLCTVYMLATAVSTGYALQHLRAVSQIRAGH